MSAFFNKLETFPEKLNVFVEKNKKILLPALSILAVIIVISIVFNLSKKPEATNSPLDNVTAADVHATPDQATVEYLTTIGEAATTRDFDYFTKTCDQEAEKSSSPEEKANVYLYCSNQAATYFDQESYSAAASFAYKAEEIFPSVNSAEAIYLYEENAEAKEKYQALTDARRENDPEAEEKALAELKYFMEHLEETDNAAYAEKEERGELDE